MAAVASSSLLCSSYTCSSYTCPSIFFHNKSISSSRTFFRTPFVTKTRVLSSLKFQAKDRGFYLVKHSDDLDFEKIKTGEKIQEVHSIDEYDKELQLPTKRLVIAHFSATHYKHTNVIHQFMKEQCRVSNEVMFLHVTADESEKTRQLCSRENIDKIPYFVFYRKTERIHEEAGFQREKLVSNMLYYIDDPFWPVAQLQYMEDLEKLIEIHKLDNKLIVVNVGMRNCVPCVKIYPSVVKLASQMSGRVIFARMNADEDYKCMKMLREMGVFKVPAFLFLKNGELCGRYIGSNMSSLIREIVKIA